jgi:hypothetical protein
MTTKGILVVALVLVGGLNASKPATSQERQQRTNGWGVSILGTLRPNSIENFEISTPGNKWLVVAVQLSPPKDEKEARFADIAVVDRSGMRYAVVSFGLARMTLSGPRVWDTMRDPQFAFTREEFAKSSRKLGLANDEAPPLVLLFEISQTAEGLVLHIGDALFPLK